MNNIDVVQILSYGVLGLGFLLALMAYNLLLKEQEREEPREPLLFSIANFMKFAIALTFIGLSSELVRYYLDSRVVADRRILQPGHDSAVSANDAADTDTKPADFEVGEEYQLDYKLKITDDSIIGDADKFAAAPELSSISKSRYKMICIAAYSEQYRLGVPIQFSWQFFDSADNLLRDMAFLDRPLSTTYQLRSCYTYFTDYPVGLYRFVVGVAGNFQEKKIRLIE